MSPPSRPPGIEAIIFDLYDTLLRIRRPVIHKKIPRLLDAKAGAWMGLVRNHLLTSRFEDREAFVRFICERLAPSRSPAVEEECLAVVEEEIGSVELLDGARTVLAFLKRRGYKLGALSNLTSVHKEPLRPLGLEEVFSAMALSCDEGLCKPQPRIYLDLCHRLGASPRSVLMVGNSLKNDVLAAEALGLSALQVARPGGRRAISSVNELGWLFLDGDGPPRPLIPRGRSLGFGRSRVVVEAVTPLADAEQGRYNLVASTRVGSAGSTDSADDNDGEVFLKRFLFPEAAYVEELAHRLMAEVGMPTCRAVVSDEPEPCLVMSKAPGRKFEGGVDPPLAFELGRHCAVAYIFANADLRPRNAFVAHEGPRPVVTMLDLEYCFFNLALDLTGLTDPMRPQTFDQISTEELGRRLRRQVLTERTTRRAMRTFFEIESMETEEGHRFQQGWIAQYERVQGDWRRIESLMEERLYREPFLIVGTKAYRRAMAKLDILDMKTRVEQDPEVLFPRLAAFKRRD